MTNPTPHGQVPEALINLIDAYAETRHRCGGIYNAKTEAARKTVIEALSGVQALSAAPAGWKLVPVKPDISMQIAAKKADMDHSPLPDWLVSDWPEFLRIWNAMLAASPTPPAEQQPPPLQILRRHGRCAQRRRRVARHLHRMRSRNRATPASRPQGSARESMCLRRVSSTRHRSPC